MTALGRKEVVGDNWARETLITKPFSEHESDKLRQRYEWLSRLDSLVAEYEPVFGESGQLKDWVVVGANAAWFQDRGWDEGVIGMRVSELDQSLLEGKPFGPEEGTWLELFGQMLQTGEPVTGEYLSESGGWYRVVAYVAEMDRFVVMEKDVTAERVAAEALKEQEARFRGLVDNDPNGVMIVNSAGVIVETNPSLEMITGLTRKELEGRYLVEVLLDLSGVAGEERPLRRQRLEEGIKAVFEEEGLNWQRREFRIFKRGDDRETCLEETVFPIRAGGERLMVGMVRDVTAEKEAQTALAESEKRYRELVVFLAQVVHDFKGPLAAIKAILQALEQAYESNEGWFDKNFMRRAGSIEETIGQLTRMVDSVLVYTNAKEALALETQRTELKGWLGELYDNQLQGIAEQSGLEIAFVNETNGSGVKVELNKDLMARAIANLVENAVKYSVNTPEKKGRVIVGLAMDERWAKISVADNGPGINRQMLKKVFQLHARETGIVGGEKGVSCGLGLATVEAVTKQHGGEVGVDSREGEGSVFEIRLPLMEAGAA